MSLLKLIRQRIREHGPITIAEYMTLALSHPEHGYYMNRDPFGVDGDFTTAPEISQVFGELIGLWLASQWMQMGRPQAALAELGPGRGTLMADALRATRKVAGFHEVVSVHLVETSPVLRAKQQAALNGKHTRINWHDSMDGLPGQPLLLVANEFFDALPIRQFVGGEERMVGLDAQGQLCFVSAAQAVILPPACGGVGGVSGEGLDDSLLTPPCPPRRRGGKEKVVETNEASASIITALGQHIARHRGVALIIDYGYPNGSRGDTLQAVRKHRYHDPLQDPGLCDLTAHVDFKALKEAAQRTGASVYGPVPQAFFLSTLGAVTRTMALCEKATPAQKSALLSALTRLTSGEQMGDLFKVMCVAHPALPAPVGFLP